MMAIRELTMWSILLRIICAVLMGGLIGLERGMKNRPAGLRTYMLVCLGACCVMLTNQYISQAFGTGDPARMGAQVVSGIGFLGAGTIIVTTRNQIKGLTTAAGLWAAACVGLAVGLGLYEIAIPSCLAIFFIMTVLHQMDFQMRKTTHTADVYIELDTKASVGKFLRFCRANEIEASNLQMEHDHAYHEDTVSFLVTLKGQHQQKHDELVMILQTMDGVRYIQQV